MNKIIHFDKLKKIINVGDCIIYPNYNQLEIGIVTKLTPKLIKINLINQLNWQGKPKYVQKYPKDTIVLEGPHVSMYLLSLQQ